MINLSRRFFLGGAIALVAAKTFVPSVNAMGNMPTIYGNGVDNDSFGLASLFRNEPVIFNKDQIGVEEHKGIVFYSGRFNIKNTVNIPKNADILMIRANFIGTDLESNAPFFLAEEGFNAQQFEGNSSFELKYGAQNRLIQFPRQTDPMPLKEIDWINGEQVAGKNKFTKNYQWDDAIDSEITDKIKLSNRNAI